MDDSEKLEAANALKETLYRSANFRRLNTDQRYTDVVEKLWRLATESVVTGIDGEEEEEHLKVFTAEEKALLRTLALNLAANSEKSTTWNEDSSSEESSREKLAPVGP